MLEDFTKLFIMRQVILNYKRLGEIVNYWWRHFYESVGNGLM